MRLRQALGHGEVLRLRGDGPGVIALRRWAAVAFLGWLSCSACAPITADDLRDQVLVVEDVVYVPGSDHPKHQLNLYLPKQAKDFPVVQFVHGGYWTDGDRNYYQALTGLYGTIGLALAREGIGTVIPSYRLNPEVRIEGTLEDVTRGVRWTVDNIAEWGGDPKRLILMGHSAGGHLIALLGLDPSFLEKEGVDFSALRGLVPMSAIWDVEHMRNNSSDAFNAKTTDPFFATNSGKKTRRMARYSPLPHLHAKAPPILLLTGEQDYDYLRVQSTTVKERLRELNIDHTLVTAPGYSHSDMVLQVGEEGDAITPAVLKFVRKLTAEE